jgi:hypothetical protein
MLFSKFNIPAVGLFILLISFADILPQSTGSLRGLVVDSATGEPLPYSNIVLKEVNSGTTTDQRGYFFFPSLRVGTYTLAVSYLGYKSEVLKVRIIRNAMAHVDVKLIPAAINLPELEKVGEKYNFEETPDVSIDRIFPRELETIPKGVETDILRSLKFLPGVSSTGDITARYNVRGGASNQNLVLLNGIPVYSPFHALGLFSVVDPDIINVAEFYKSGFPLEYRGRLSSLLKITTKDGNKNRFGGIASGSFLSGKGLFEGPLPDGSFLISGRKSYSNKILRRFLNDKNVPVDFYDLSFNMNYSNPEFLQDAKFTFTGFLSSDNLDNPDPLQEDFKWKNQLFGLTYFQWVTGSPLFYQLNLFSSYFSGEVIPNFSQARAKKNEVSDMTVRAGFTYIFENDDELTGGIEFANIKSNLKLENVRKAFTEVNDQGTNVSIFTKYKLSSIQNLIVEGGTRFNFTRLANGTAGEFSFEPRINLSYRVLKWITFKGAWGIYQQELTTISDENELITVFEPWVVTPSYLKPATAVHYVSGFNISPTAYLNFEIEGYYKLIHNLTAVNERKYFADDPDIIAGSGEAYGLEFLTIINNQPISLNIAYSLSWAFKEVYGLTYQPRYDSRHNLSILLGYNFGSGWSASAAWSFNSGLPFTQIIGFYNKLYFNDLGNRDYFFVPYTILASKNLGRLPDYHRLDLSLSKEFNIGILKFRGDVSVINVYDRKNLFYFDRTTGERVNMLPFLPTATLRIEI